MATTRIPMPANPVCAGTGKRWGSGTGTPVCPVCHVGPKALGARPPRRYSAGWTGTVPAHFDLRGHR